jgi:succinate dehydrogenase / fumarate reductase cytochrome b subunit
MNNQARPIPYAVKNNIKTSTASATMAETGMLILAFVVFHLAHFTLGYVQPEYFHLTDSKGRHDVYRIVVEGFRHGYYSIAYMIFMTILGLHLSHGIASVLQTLGFNHSRYSPQINRCAPLLAWVLAFGYITIPLGVLFGFVH